MNQIVTTNTETQSMDMASQIVAMASNPDFDVAKLEKLMELQERVANHQSVIAFNQDFSVMQSKLPVIAKNKKGQSNKYATLEDIIAKTRPILQEFGFATSFETQTVLNDNKNNCFVEVVAVLTHRMGHSTRTSLLVPFDFSGNKSANYAQAMGSAVSYGKRYALCALLNIATQDDDDGMATSQDNKITKAQREHLQKLYDRLSDDSKIYFDGQLINAFGSAKMGNIPLNQYQNTLIELQKLQEAIVPRGCL
ncbi:ERF family protein [Moraxella bovis]|uniref:ERF family protein n=1 Tax=Moraxella bovis TaxID=476 RepID=UPI002226BCE3|nr:ERF family protein [Moraxella bovis]UZA41972.1 ERF family protein [Moraxella bovis]